VRWSSGEPSRVVSLNVAFPFAVERTRALSIPWLSLYREFAIQHRVFPATHAPQHEICCNKPPSTTTTNLSTPRPPSLRFKRRSSS
jgi:hypothetical protein